MKNRLIAALLPLVAGACSPEAIEVDYSCRGTADCPLGEVCYVPDRECVPEPADGLMGTFRCVPGTEYQHRFPGADVLGTVDEARHVLPIGATCLLVDDAATVSFLSVDFDVTLLVTVGHQLTSSGGEREVQAPRYSFNYQTALLFSDLGEPRERVLAHSTGGTILLEQPLTAGELARGFVDLEMAVPATRGVDWGADCAGLGDCGNRRGTRCDETSDGAGWYCTAECEEDADCTTCVPEVNCSERDAICHEAAVVCPVTRRRTAPLGWIVSTPTELVGVGSAVGTRRRLRMVMRRTMRFGLILLPLALQLGACNAGESSPEGYCTATRDCTGSDICVDGECVSEFTRCLECRQEPCAETLDLCADNADCTWMLSCIDDSREAGKDWGDCDPETPDGLVIGAAVLGCEVLNCAEQCGHDSVSGGCESDGDCGDDESCVDGSCLDCTDCSGERCVAESRNCGSACEELLACMVDCDTGECLDHCATDVPDGVLPLHGLSECMSTECEGACGSRNFMDEYVPDAGTGGAGAGGAGPGSGGEETGGLTGFGGIITTTGGVPTGGWETGGESTGGVAAGGYGATGGEETGGEETGGEATGGEETGGYEPGGYETGGEETGGYETGGEATGGEETGGYETGGGGTGGGGTMNLEEAAEAMADATCAKYEACNPYWFELEHGSQTGCAANLTRFYVWQAAMPDTGWSVDNFESCIGATEDQSCDDWLDRTVFLDECRVAGDRENGAACLDGSQCASTYCDASEFACGVCVVPPVSGAPCTTDTQCLAGERCADGGSCYTPQGSLGSCAEGEECNFGYTCVDGICRARAEAVGDPCGPDVGSPWCAPGLICNGGYDGAPNECVAWGVAHPGETCGWTQSDTVWLACSEGGVCTGTGATCPERAVAGDACDDDEGPWCVYPDKCHEGICVSPPSYGSTCGG
jgi:hypothetical protein